MRLAAPLMLALFCFAAIGPRIAFADESQRSLSELQVEVVKLTAEVDLSNASP